MVVKNIRHDSKKKSKTNKESYKINIFEPQKSLERCLAVWCCFRLCLIRFGHDGASFVAILLFEKMGYGFIKWGTDPIFYKMGSPTPPEIPLRTGPMKWVGSVTPFYRKWGLVSGSFIVSIFGFVLGAPLAGTFWRG